MADPYFGMIMLWPSPRIPDGWHVCDGTLLSVSTNQVLYSLIGTTYGGDGVKQFALPDLRGRTVVGVGTGTGLSPYTLAQKAGAELVQLDSSTMAIHTHASSISGVSVTATAQLEMSTTTANENAVQSKSDALAATNCTNPGDVPDVYGYGPAANMIAIGTAVNPALSGSAVSIGISGGNVPHNNLQPYLPINYIICINGIYPPNPNN